MKYNLIGKLTKETKRIPFSQLQRGDFFIFECDLTNEQFNVYIKLYGLKYYENSATYEVVNDTEKVIKLDYKLKVWVKE